MTALDRLAPPGAGTPFGVGAIGPELSAVLSFRLRQGERTRAWAAPVAVIVALVLSVGLPLTAAVTWAGLAGSRASAVIGTVAVVLPAAWLFFLVAAIVSASAGAGGRQLLSRSPAAVFPVSPATDHAGALLLTPLNIAWTAQAASLLLATGIAVGPDPVALPRQWVLTLLWILAATCVAQVVGWGVELVRTYAGGDLVVRTSGAVILGGAGWLVVTGRIGGVLDRSPTTAWALAGLAAVRWQVYAATAASLVVVAAAAFLVAIPLVAQVSRRPALEQARIETRPVAPVPGGEDTLAVRLDRRLVLRSVPLRRGLTILVLAPLAAAALIPLPWTGITILPALITAAAGLLYGVNAFVLDGAGAVWRDSLPQPPAEWLRARLLVLTEVCLTAGATVTVAAALRSDSVPTVTEAVAVVCSVLVALAQVVGRCARWSVRRPHAAQLRGPRDAPAPPVTLAGCSIRLTAATTMTGLLFAGAGQTGEVTLPVALALVFVLLAVRRLVRVRRDFDALPLRAVVTATVARA